MSFGSILAVIKMEGGTDLDLQVLEVQTAAVGDATGGGATGGEKKQGESSGTKASNQTEAESTGSRSDEVNSKKAPEEGRMDEVRRTLKQSLCLLVDRGLTPPCPFFLCCSN